MNTKLYTSGSVSGGLRARNTKYGFVLPLVLFGIIILMALIIGATMTDYHTRLEAVKTKSQAEAMLAAEAGYEKSIFWMSQQSDILTAIQNGSDNGTIDFGSATCSYTVDFNGFMGAKPVFSIVSTGVSGRPSFTRVVSVNVIQETCGWAMGACMVPGGPSIADETPVYFGNGEVIDMPLHINKQNDNPDIADIFISSTGGNPTFLQKIEMGEDRNTSGGADKYSSYMSLFHAGITFSQPNVRITDATAIQSKVNRFHDSTAAAYIFTPSLAGCPTTSPFNTSSKCAAVQLEFFVQGGVGYVKITNNCAVVLANPGANDYNIVTGSNPTSFHQYQIYGYHYKPTAAGNQTTISIDGNSSPCYVAQTFGGYTSQKGGQIFVNGNVIIGGDSNATLTDPNQVVKGRMTVVATGNIWIADSIRAYGNVDRSIDPNGIPDANTNTSVLGLIAQGVIKVVDTGQLTSSPASVASYTYQPIGMKKNVGDANYVRYLPDPTVVDAAITVGGGGWGAENVVDPTHGRRVYSAPQDFLIVHGSITEVVRGIVGHLGSDGYIKQYFIDTRLMSGILPGDIWLSGKYYPAPAGWHDDQTAD